MKNFKKVNKLAKKGKKDQAKHIFCEFSSDKTVKTYRYEDLSKQSAVFKEIEDMVKGGVYPISVPLLTHQYGPT